MVKSILRDIRRVTQNKKVEKIFGWVLWIVLCLFSSTSSQRPKNSQHYRCTQATFTSRNVADNLHPTFRAMMLDEMLDLVVGDFNNSNNISINDKAFADCTLPMPPGPTPLWRLGAVSNEWVDVCGTIKPPNSDGQQKIRQHGAFSVPPEALSIRPTDQRCHHEAWLHFNFVVWRNEQPYRENTIEGFSWKNALRHTITEKKGHISDVRTDHSLSLWLRDHSPNENNGLHQVTLWRFFSVWRPHVCQSFLVQFTMNAWPSPHNVPKKKNLEVVEESLRNSWRDSSNLEV